MPEKLGNGGHSQEQYDPNTGKYVIDGKPNKYYDNPDENKIIGGKRDLIGSAASNDERQKFLGTSKWKPEWREFLKHKEEKPDEPGTISQIAPGVEEIAKEYGLNLIKGKHSAEEDVKVVNPNFMQGKQFQENCVSCAICYELRRRGIDAEAQARSDYLARNYEGYFDSYSGVLLDKNGNKAKWIKPNISRKENVKRTLDEEFSKYPEGTRFFMHCSWSQYSGHAFCVEIINGKPEWIEPQRGNIMNEAQINWRIHIAQPTKFAFMVANDIDFDRGYNDRTNVIKAAVKNKE